MPWESAHLEETHRLWQLEIEESNAIDTIREQERQKLITLAGDFLHIINECNMLIAELSAGLGLDQPTRPSPLDIPWDQKYKLRNRKSKKRIESTYNGLSTWCLFNHDKILDRTQSNTYLKMKYIKLANRFCKLLDFANAQNPSYPDESPKVLRTLYEQYHQDIVYRWYHWDLISQYQNYLQNMISIPWADQEMDIKIEQTNDAYHIRLKVLQQDVVCILDKDGDVHIKPNYVIDQINHKVYKLHPQKPMILFYKTYPIISPLPDKLKIKSLDVVQDELGNPNIVANLIYIDKKSYDETSFALHYTYDEWVYKPLPCEMISPWKNDGRYSNNAYQLVVNPWGNTEVNNMMTMIDKRIILPSSWEIAHKSYNMEKKCFEIVVARIWWSAWYIATLPQDLSSLVFDPSLQDPDLPYADFCDDGQCYQVISSKQQSGTLFEIRRADITWIQIKQWMQDNLLDSYPNQPNPSLSNRIQSLDLEQLQKIESILRYIQNCIGDKSFVLHKDLSPGDSLDDYKNNLIKASTYLIKLYDQKKQKVITQKDFFSLVNSIVHFNPYTQIWFDYNIHKNMIKDATKRKRYQEERFGKFTDEIERINVSDSLLHELEYIVWPTILWSILKGPDQDLLQYKRYVPWYLNRIDLTIQDWRIIYSVIVNNDLLRPSTAQWSQKNVCSTSQCASWSCALPADKAYIPAFLNNKYSNTSSK